MEQRLVAAGQRRANAFALSRFAPIGCGGNSAMVRGKADQYRLTAVFLTHELADIELAALAHFRRARVAEMRIMLPYRQLRAAALAAKMGNHRIERFGHMAV